MRERLQGRFFDEAFPIGRFAAGHAEVVNKYGFVNLLAVVIN
ncbi:hypothetical protein [Marinococcus halophilus]|nr:hypothetical protein [Marinococcus halophilus]